MQPLFIPCGVMTCVSVPAPIPYKTTECGSENGVSLSDAWSEAEQEKQKLNSAELPALVHLS